MTVVDERGMLGFRAFDIAPRRLGIDIQRDGDDFESLGP
jgi:hypothetical protein